MARRPRKHPAVREACFFKILLGDFTQRMRIPPAFLKNLCGKIIDESILRCHDGNFWPVKVKRDCGNLFFQEGWPDFVKNNCIEAGEFLVFKYDGNAGFDVQIFGKSGCEKLKPLPDDNDCKFVKSKGVCQCKYMYKSVTPSGEGSQMEKTLVRFRRKKVFCADRCPFGLKNPHFISHWRSNKPYALLIPQAFANEQNLSSKKLRIFRDQNGRTWPVRILHSSTACNFGAGWLDFRVANNLGEGDKCIFEFIDGDIIQVHVLRGKD